MKKKKVAEAKDKGLPLPPKKRNIRPPLKLKKINNSINETNDDSLVSGTSGILIF